MSYLLTLPGVAADRLAAVGYSFGAGVALAAARDSRLRAIVAISPPLAAVDDEVLAGCAQPKLILYGQSDQMVRRADLERSLVALSSPIARQAFPGVDHFWRGCEGPMAAAVADFLVAHV